MLDCVPTLGPAGYSAIQVIDLTSELITGAFRGIFPVELDSLNAVVMFGCGRQFTSASEILSYVEGMITDVEAKLDACDAKR